MLGVAASLALAALVVGADQVAKRRVVAHLAVGQTGGGAGPARLRLVVNRRGGLVAVPLRWAWALWAAVAALALWAVAGPAIEVAAVAAGLVVGGGAANLVDRSTRGGVVDFIAVGSWPTFNLADVALVAGAGLAVVAVAAGA